MLYDYDPEEPDSDVEAPDFMEPDSEPSTQVPTTSRITHMEQDTVEHSLEIDVRTLLNMIPDEALNNAPRITVNHASIQYVDSDEWSLEDNQYIEHPDDVTSFRTNIKQENPNLTPLRDNSETHQSQSFIQHKRASTTYDTSGTDFPLPRTPSVHHNIFRPDQVSSFSRTMTRESPWITKLREQSQTISQENIGHSKLQPTSGTRMSQSIPGIFRRTSKA